MNEVVLRSHGTTIVRWWKQDQNAKTKTKTS